MQKPYFVSTSVDRLSLDTIVECIIALGLDHSMFLMVNVAGVTALLFNETYEIDNFKLSMLRTALDGFNANASK